MNKIFFIIFVGLFDCICAFSLSDTLIIRFKNSFVEKISLDDIQKITFEKISGVEEGCEDYASLTAKGNYPNPFSERTTIEFEIATAGNVQIVIYDNNAQQVQILNCDNCSAGKNRLEWNCLDKDGKLVPAGVYFYEVCFDKEIQSRKMILVK